MREFLFRGKRADNGEWVYSRTFLTVSDENGENDEFFMGQRGDGCVIHINGFGNIVAVGDTIPDEPTEMFYKVRPETVGQSTGITDCNGALIFEGDVVHAKEFNLKGGKYNDHNYAIEFHNGSFVAVKNCKGRNWLDIGFVTICGGEVIGNIHENPELLEEMGGNG